MAIIRRVFDNDKKLPRLPLPPVRQTMERYYESLQPLFTESELLEIKKKIDEFLAPKHQVIGENGEKQMVSTADVLQKRLVEYEKTQQYSWLELWWEEMAYLGWREPLFINSNYWVSIFPHPKPYGQIGYKELGIKTRMEPGRAVFKNVGYSEFQIRVAASMINKAVEFKDMLDNEQLPSHLVGSKPMCMNQFKNLFGVTRLPRPERDEIYKYTGYIKYIIVMVRNQIYRVPIYTEKGKRLLDGDMEDLLNRVVEDAQSLKDSELEPPIGIISAGHRDRWAAAYAELAQHNNPTAQATLQEIQHSAFAVSLEDFCVPKERDEASFQRLLKSGANSGHNRWYDKHISMIFDRNGNYGAMGEHSPADAVVPAYLHEYVATQTYNSKVKLEKDRGSPSVFRSVGSDGTRLEYPEYRGDSVESPKRLKFGKVSENVLNMIKETEQELQVLEQESVGQMVYFQKYGSKYIKKLKVSPDSYVQMALQLSYYKIHGKFAPTYESASTRMYQHGRTETIRSLTNEMAAFVKTMMNREASTEEKYAALQATSKKHSQVVRMASSGQGIDRHMLGLRLACSRLRPIENEPRCDFADAEAVFSDAAFAKSSTWSLSTSGLFPNTVISHAGFGCPVMQEGYGMNYIINPEAIKLGLEGKTGPRAGKSDVTLYAQTLCKVLEEMQFTFARVIEGEKKHNVGSSKL